MRLLLPFAFGLLLAQSAFGTFIISSYPTTLADYELSTASAGGAFTMRPASFQVDTVTFRVGFIGAATARREAT